MSRRTVQEYTAQTRRRYTQANKAKRRMIPKEFTEATHFSRSYAIKLLTGNRKFRGRPGRGKTYGEKSTKVLKQIWSENGCMNTRYLKTKISDWVVDGGIHIAVFPSEVR